MESAQQNSVRSLQALYSVVVGLALAAALDSVIDPVSGAVPIRFEALPLLLALIITLIPFYHGALRHLDITFIEEGGKHVRSGALLVDFVILFLEGCVFLALARLLTQPQAFAWGLLTLFVIDIVWAVAAHFAFTAPGEGQAELQWLQNNAAAAVVVLVYTLVTVSVFTASEREIFLSWGIAAIALARTIVDYKRSWYFYYPASTNTSQVA